jgi:hypothetical protein
MLGEPLTPDFVYLTDIKQTVAVGEVMTTSAPLLVNEKITFNSKLEATTLHRNSQFKVTAEPGIYVLVAKGTAGYFYEAEDSPVVVNSRKTVGGIYVPSDETTEPALYWHWSNSLRSPLQRQVYIAEIKKLPTFTSSKSNTPTGEYGFLTTLSYAGVANNQIKFVYREYKNQMARDAFTQEVSLDYVPESIFAYKSARFIVHYANNSQISYTLLKPL